MAQIIKLKRSATPGQVPTTAQLDLGELGINTNDGKLFFKKDDGTAVILEVGGSISGSASKVSSSAGAPTDPVPTQGDLWFDTVNNKLMYYNGAAWEEVGNTLTDFETTGDTTLGDDETDTLTVNATTTFESPVDMNDTLNVDGNLTTTANTTLGNAATDTLTVNADATFNDDVTISGITANEIVYADASNDLTGSGNFTYNGTTMTLAGPAVFNGNVDLGDATSDTITATGRFDSALVPSTNNANDLGTSALRWQDIYGYNVDLSGNLIVDGNTDLGNATSDTITATGRFDSALVPSTNNARDLGTTALRWKDIYGYNVDLSGNLVVDGSTTLGDAAADTHTLNGSVDINHTLNVDGAATFKGNVDLGDAATDTISFTGRADTDLVPSTDNARDLGTSALRWQDIYGYNVDLSGNLIVDGNTDLGNATSDTITATGRFDSAIVPSTNNANDLGTSALRWQDIYGYNVDLSGNLVVDGNTDLGNATTDTISFTGRADTDLVPSTDNARDLGTSALRWSQVHATNLLGGVNSIRTAATDPTTQGDGTALVEGDIYYNTTDDAIKTYDGANWNTSFANAVVIEGESNGDPVIGDFTNGALFVVQYNDAP